MNQKLKVFVLSLRHLSHSIELFLVWCVLCGRNQGVFHAVWPRRWWKDCLSGARNCDTLSWTESNGSWSWRHHSQCFTYVALDIDSFWVEKKAVIVGTICIPISDHLTFSCPCWTQCSTAVCSSVISPDVWETDVSRITKLDIQMTPRNPFILGLEVKVTTHKWQHSAALVGWWWQCRRSLFNRVGRGWLMVTM